MNKHVETTPSVSKLGGDFDGVTISNHSAFVNKMRFYERRYDTPIENRSSRIDPRPFRVIKYPNIKPTYLNLVLLSIDTRKRCLINDNVWNPNERMSARNPQRVHYRYPAWDFIKRKHI